MFKQIFITTLTISALTGCQMSPQQVAKPPTSTQAPATFQSEDAVTILVEGENDFTGEYPYSPEKLKDLRQQIVNQGTKVKNGAVTGKVYLVDKNGTKKLEANLIFNNNSGTVTIS